MQQENKVINDWIDTFYNYKNFEFDRIKDVIVPLWFRLRIQTIDLHVDLDWIDVIVCIKMDFTSKLGKIKRAIIEWAMSTRFGRTHSKHVQNLDPFHKGCPWGLRFSLLTT